MNRFFLMTLMICASFNGVGQNLNKQIRNSPGSERFEVGQELILTGRLDNLFLGEVFALKSETEVFIELESFINVLDFPISSSNQRTRFAGWFSEESNTFELELDETSNLTVFVRGIAQSINAKDYTVEFGSLYIDHATLSRWFEIEFQFDYTRLEITYLPLSPLPVQRKLKRQLTRIYAAYDDTEYPELARGYEILSPQAIDLYLAASYFESSDRYAGIYSAIGSREIAQHNVRFALNGSSRETFRDGTINVSKISRDNQLLGILGASRYEFGDITPIQIGSVATSNRAVGLRLQSTNSSQRFNRQTTSINGDVQIGWDIELYRNGTLIGQIFDSQQNRYEFNDIDLVFGDNRFEIILYGPQGQIVKETKTETVENTNIDTEGIAYQFSLGRLNDSILPQEFNEELDNSLVANLSLAKNIAEQTSLNFGFQTTLNNGNDKFVSLGINTRVFDNILLAANLNSNLDNQYTLNSTLRTNIFDQSLTLNTSVSEIKNDITDEAEQTYSSSLLLTGNISTFGSQKISYTNNITYSGSDNGTSLSFQNAMTLNSKLGTFFHNIAYQETSPKHSDTDSNTQELIGGFGLQGSIGGVFTRVFTNYDANDSFDLQSISASLNWTPSPSLKTRFLYSQNLDGGDANYNLNLTWTNELMNIGADIRVTGSGGYNLGLNTNISFGGLPFNKDVFTTKQALSSTGTIAVRVFEDKNGNNEFDKGERLIPNIRVKAGKYRSSALTDDTGIALLHKLPTFAPTSIGLENESEEDPYLQPIIEGVSIQAREGFIDNLDYPMVQTSELEGTIYFPGEEGAPATFAKLVLKKNGQVLRAVKAEFDGYFLVTDLKPGIYTLELENDYASKNDFKIPLRSNIQVNYDSNVIILDDLIIEQEFYEEAYIVNIGLYTDKALAKTQQLLFNKRFSQLQLPPTIEVVPLKNKQDEKFVVAAAIVRSSELASKYCTFLRNNGMACDLIEHRVKVPY